MQIEIIARITPKIISKKRFSKQELYRLHFRCLIMADILLTDDFTKTQVHEDEILSKTFLNSAEKLNLNLGHFFSHVQKNLKITIILCKWFLSN